MTILEFDAAGRQEANFVVALAGGLALASRGPEMSNDCAFCGKTMATGVPTTFPDPHRCAPTQRARPWPRVASSQIGDAAARLSASRRIKPAPRIL